MTNWTEVNRLHWDERAEPHARSADYAVEDLVADPLRLSDVVTFDLPLLGDITGLRGVHLQCHIGTDTLSLHRLGARMSGLDFSAAGVEQARALADRAGADIDYVRADVHDALEVLPHGAFDLVFTGIGALCWLPRIEPWAEIVATLLAPGGRLFIREGHPALWAVDDEREDELITLRYPYFETPEPLVYDSEGTYVATEHRFVNTQGASWNHGLGEIITALLANGLQLTGLVEHDTVPWEAVPGRMVRDDRGEWTLADRPERLPHSYTLQAVKPAG